MRTIDVVVAAVLLAIGAGSTASAQHPESLDTTPNWPSPYRGIIVPGQVTAVDPARGTATVNTEAGEVTMDLGSNAVPDIAPGDRVNLQLLPSGRSPSAVGGVASDPGLVGRILPVPPPVQPGVGMEDAQEDSP